MHRSLFSIAAFLFLGLAVPISAEEAPQTEKQRLESLLAKGEAATPYDLYDIGSLLEFGGTGVEPDLARAMTYYRRAAEMGEGISVYALNYHLLDTESPYYDEKEAIRLLRKQVAINGPNSGEYRRYLAHHLATTPSEMRDLKGAIALLRSGKPADDPYILSALATLLTPQGDDDDAANALRDPHEAIRIYEQFLALAEGKDAVDEMAALASLYNGNIVDGVDNAAKAAFWIDKSVAGESALGYLYLGDFTFYGSAGKNYDYGLAKRYWSKAAELRTDWDLSERIQLADEALTEDRKTVTAAAMVTLAEHYEYGLDRPVDWNKAQYWYQRAVDAGTTDRNAISTLASFHELDGSHAKAAVLWRRLATGKDEIATDARRRLTEYETALAAAKPKAMPVPATPKPAVTAATRPAAAQSGAPSARQIRDALVYEHHAGRVTVGDALGLAQRSVDYERGISRVTTFGITADVSYAVANPKCTPAGNRRYNCKYDLQMVMMGFPYNGPGSHTFEVRDGIWRSPTYLKALVDAGNRSAAGANNGRFCTVQGFGTAEGPAIRDQNGLYC